MLRAAAFPSPVLLSNSGQEPFALTIFYGHDPGRANDHADRHANACRLASAGRLANDDPAIWYPCIRF